MVWNPEEDWDELFEDRDEEKPRKRGSVIRTPEQRIQKTWNGIPVRSMESSHIMNSILYCERKFADGVRNYRECFGEDAPGFYFESVFDMFPEYVNLRDEWKLRLEKK